MDVTEIPGGATFDEIDHFAGNQIGKTSQNLDPDLAGPTGPIEPVLARLDPLLVTPIQLSEEQIRQLIAFVENGLLDPRANPDHLRALVPVSLPSGRPALMFEFP